ncbi:MAG: relaxase domain-containing protein [Actinomycetota bacterium]|nr:relaxase domain-containing protein [Actinomycetota bacterium]
MLNIGKLARGQQHYYLNSVARGVEDYYMGSGEPPGYWLGGGATDLGLEGRVLERALTPVLEGSDPATGEVISHRQHKARMPGFDLTFRAPKSVSLLHALGPKDASNEVVNAHDAAIAAALAYLERHTAVGRRGTDGVEPIGSSGFVAAAFRHRTSRAGDPLLHTHVLVANLIHCWDHKWSALDGRLLYSHAKTAGYLYQAQLRKELTRRLGVEWTQVRNGTAEIEGIPRATITEFSRRRAEIEIRMEQRGEHSARAAQVATLDTRRAKDHKVRPEGLQPEWERRAKGVGLTRNDLANVLDRTQETRRRLSRDLAEELFGPDGLTRDASSFTVREVIQALCERRGPAVSALEIEREAERLLSSDLVVRLSAAKSDFLLTSSSLRLANGQVVPAVNDGTRYSTKELIRLEERLIRRAVDRQTDSVGIADRAVLREILARRSSLTPEQHRMVEGLTRSGRGVDVAVGKAGAGKTFALDAAREVWESSGIKVIGCALSARAAKELQAGSGIESSTLAALMKDLDDWNAPGLDSDSVVVVDEAGMVGTRQLDALLNHAEDAGAKVVLVGDDKQLPEIAAGGAFRALKEQLPAIELSEVRRQTNSWERDALELLREGRSAEAVEVYGERDRLVVGRDAAETRAALVADWWQASQQGQAVMIAARKADVADLNDKARTILKAEGVLGDEELVMRGRPFAVGDEVMTLRNERSLGVINGSRGVVQSVDLHAGQLEVRLADDRIVTLSTEYLEAGHVTHAYAITGHKAQGMTTDRSFVLGDDSLYREWGYVAMSRGREENRLYVVMGDGHGRDDVGGAVERPYQVDQLVRSLERSRAKSLAFDPYGDIAEKDSKSLRVEQETIYEQLSRGPRDPRDKLIQVRQEVERIGQLLQQERRAAAEAEEKLASMGAVAKARRKAEVERLRRKVNRSRRAQNSLTGKLRLLADQENELVQSQQQWDRWTREQSPLVTRVEEIESELERRNRATLRDRENNLPKYLESWVGAMPERPSEKHEWRKAVSAIEGYRERYGITDEKRALGPEPRNADQRWEKEQVERHIEEHNGRRLGRSHDNDVGLERSLEMSL